MDCLESQKAIHIRLCKEVERALCGDNDNELTNLLIEETAKLLFVLRGMGSWTFTTTPFLMKRETKIE